MAYAALLVFCLALFLPGLTALPPFDRDEARFAQASKQMLEENDFIRIKYQEQDRHKKPVGIYWMQALAAKATTQNAIWPYRLPSILGAVLAVLLTFHLGRRALTASNAFLGAALLACSLLLVVEAHLAKTDAMLLASITGMQVALARFYIRKPDASPEPWLWLLFWSAAGFSILLKGPVGPVIAALTIIVLLIADRKNPYRFGWLKGLRPAVGLLLVAAMVAPWLWAVTEATQGSFLKDAVTGDLLPKLISGHESHGAPPGLYFLLFTLTFWPGSLLAWPALASAWQNRSSNRLVRFLWAWIIPTWIMFELVPTKLPHYILPVYPAIALLIAAWLGGFAEDAKLSKPFKWLVPIATTLWLIIGVVLTLGLAVAPVYMDKSLSWWGIAAGLTVGGTTLLAWHLYRLRAMTQTCAVLLVGATLVFGMILGQGLPEMRGFWVSRSIQQTLDSLRAEHPELDGPVAAAGFHEPSMVFLLGTKTRLVSHADAARHLADHPDGLALVETRREQQFFDGLDESGITARRLAIVRGFNYSKGQWINLGVYTGTDASTILTKEFP